MVDEIAIPSSSDDAAVAHHHCSHRHFSGLEGALGATQRFLHPTLVHGKVVRGKIVLISHSSKYGSRRSRGRHFRRVFTVGTRFPMIMIVSCAKRRISKSGVVSLE